MPHVRGCSLFNTSVIIRFVMTEIRADSPLTGRYPAYGFARDGACAAEYWLGRDGAGCGTQWVPSRAPACGGSVSVAGGRHDS